MPRVTDQAVPAKKVQAKLLCIIGLLGVLLFTSACGVPRLDANPSVPHSEGEEHSEETGEHTEGEVHSEGTEESHSAEGTEEVHTETAGEGEATHEAEADDHSEGTEEPHTE